MLTALGPRHTTLRGQSCFLSLTHLLLIFQSRSSLWNHLWVLEWFTGHSRSDQVEAATTTVAAVPLPVGSSQFCLVASAVGFFLRDRNLLSWHMLCGFNSWFRSLRLSRFGLEIVRSAFSSLADFMCDPPLALHELFISPQRIRIGQKQISDHSG